MERQLLRLSIRDITRYHRDNRKVREFMDESHPELWKSILIGDLFAPEANVDEISKTLDVFKYSDFVEWYRKFEGTIFMGFENPFAKELSYYPTEDYSYIIGISPKGAEDGRFFPNYPPVKWENLLAFLYTGRYAINNNVLTFGPIFYNRNVLEDDVAEEVHHMQEATEVFLVEESIMVTVRVSLVMAQKDGSFYVFYDDCFDIDVGTKQIYNGESGILDFANGRAQYDDVETDGGEHSISAFRILRANVNPKAVEFLNVQPNISRRIRIHERLTHTITETKWIDEKLVARIAPENIPIHSHDEQNLDCTLPCGHVTPLEYLKWWIQEERDPEQPVCPQCRKSISVKIYADSKKKDKENAQTSLLSGATAPLQSEFSVSTL